MKTEFELTMIRGNNIGADRIKEIAELEKLVFAEDVAIPEQVLMSWYDKNPDIFICVMDKSINKIIGYVSVIPLNSSTFIKTVNNGFDDRELVAKNIECYDRLGFYRLYLCSIIVHPAYQGASLAYRMLTDGYIELLLELAERNIYIIETSAMAVSGSGSRVCEFWDMTLIAKGLHDSNMYYGHLLPPTFKLYNKKSKMLYECYSKEYQQSMDEINNNYCITN